MSDQHNLLSDNPSVDDLAGRPGDAPEAGATGSRAAGRGLLYGGFSVAVLVCAACGSARASDASPVSPATSEATESVPSTGAPVADHAGGGTSFSDANGFVLEHDPPDFVRPGELASISVATLCPLDLVEDAGEDCVRSISLAAEQNQFDLRMSRAGDWRADLVPEADSSGRFSYTIRVTFRDGSVRRFPDSGEYSTPVVDDTPIQVELEPSRSVDVAVPVARIELATGSEADQIGVIAPNEGEAGGPSGFGVLPDGAIAIMDYVNGGLSVSRDGQATRTSTPCLGHLVVDSKAGAGLIVGEATACSVSAEGLVGEPVSIDLRGRGIPSVGPGTAMLVDSTLWVLDGGSNWVPVADESGRPVSASQGVVPISPLIEARGVDWKIADEVHGLSWIVHGDSPLAAVTYSRFLDDGAVLVVGTDSSTSEDRQVQWVLVLDQAGLRYATQIDAEALRQPDGPEFDYANGQLYAMTSSESAVAVSAYDLNGAPE